MTAFDALMSGRVLNGSPAGGRAGARGAAGDWRQAVEQAQAKSWLGNRNVDAGRSPSPHSEAPSKDVAVSSATRHATPADRDVVSARGPRSEVWAGQPSEGVNTPPPATYAPLAQRSTLPPVAISARITPAAPLEVGAVERPVAPAALAYVQGVRPRKQSVHVETGEQGISVWLRDAALNRQQANHVAAAIVANLEAGGQSLVALYLNGRAVVDGPATISSLSSSPNPSE